MKAEQMLRNRTMLRGPRCGAVHCARGQALSEFVIVSLFLFVPLFALMPVLAQMISARQDTEVAARYSAWERTVWHQSPPSYTDPTFAATTVKSDDQIAKELDTRVFSNGYRQIYTTQTPDTPHLKPFMTVMYMQPPGTLWGPLFATRTGSTPANPRYASHASTNTDPPGLTKTMMSRFVRALNAFFRFDLNTKGLVQTQVSVTLMDLSWLCPAPICVNNTLAYNRSLTLFTDSWNPGGRGHAEYLIAGLVPEELTLDKPLIHGIQSTIGLSPIRRDVRYDNLNFGYVNIDPVPNGRLTSN